VTISLDGPASFEQELIDGPARLFFDIKGVEAPPDLVGAVLRYPANVVRQIRVGRHPDAIRVVLDFEEVARHSVYTLQDPFRIVVHAAGEAASVRTGNDAAPTAAQSASLTTPAATGPAPSETSRAVTPVRPALDSPARSSPAGAEGVERGTTAAGVEPAAPPARAGDPSASRSTPPTAVPAPPRGNSSGGFSIARQLGLGVSRIVIDPGHGGHDPGAQVGGLDEADLTLDIALRLEKLLQKEPGLEVVLTRRTDVYVPLEERTAIANREQADLFLSIHANTSRNRTARGVETYYLSFAGSPDAEEVAARENSANPGEMHRLPDLLKAIALNNKLDESRDFAGMVQEALVSRLRRSSRSIPDRGVRKAPFVVLIGAQMPSVLAEVAFMSNRHDLALLKTDVFKQRIAEALHAGIMRYRRALKAMTTVASQ
jgi:N-acetylmuramoyl-L-alanine amidase